MRHLRRLIVVLTGFAMSSVAATTVAYAAQPLMRPDPGGGVVIYPPSNSSAADVGTPVWEFLAFAALGALLAVAVVGLIVSLRHRRTSEQPSRMMRA